jgi:hypothetical protein
MKKNKNGTGGLVWWCVVLLAVLLAACDPGYSGAEEGSGVDKVRSAVSISKSLRLQPLADLQHIGWTARPVGLDHWDVLNGRGDVSCANSARNVNTNSMTQLDDNTKLDSSFISKGVTLTTGGVFWVCARQYTFTDSEQSDYGVAMLRAVLRQRNAQGAEVRSAVLGSALMQSAGPDNHSDSAPRWYAFSVPSGWTFSAGDTLVGGLRSADGRARLQVYKYLVDVNYSVPLTFP